MTDKKICLEAILPTIVIAVCKDALLLNKGESGESVFELKEKALAYFFSIVKSNKLIKRIERCCHRVLTLFVDKQDGTYSMRKVILALHQVTQQLYDEGLVSIEAAQIVADILEIEGQTEADKQAWIKLKASADKKVIDIIKIIKEI